MSYYSIVLLIAGCIFILSCQSDDIVGINNLDEKQLKNITLFFDQSTSKTLQGSSLTNESPVLYSGIIETGDTVSTFINLQSENLSSHLICLSDSIISFKIVFNFLPSEDPIVADYLKIRSFKNINLLDESLGSIVNQMNGTLLPDESINLSNDKIEIDLYDFDHSIINSICIEKINIGLEISYVPPEEISKKIIELYSSEISNASVKPSINMDYYINEIDTFNVNRYSVEQVSWLDNFSEPHFISDSSNSEWGTIYLFDFIDINQIGDSFNYNEIQIDSDIVINNINTEIDLLQIDIKAEFDTLIFFINNAMAFISEEDPAQDNWSLTNPESTEGNGELDWVDHNENKRWDIGEGEKWYDYGHDNCVDEWETGNSISPCDSINNIYNSEGTEGNNKLDWTDNNGNGIWDIGEGEIWWDWGLDWCPDSLENGQGNCIAEDTSCNCNVETTEFYDQNDDNFDPEGDDFPAGKEGNGIWDEGELFYDWGLDGLPASIIGYLDNNGTENNNVCDWIDTNNDGNWDFGEGEQWFDTGIDGKFNTDEVGNYENRMENNFSYNTGEKYLDCGEGENEFDINYNCIDDGIEDDFNIDPNQDNFDQDSDPLIMTENNGYLDWEDTNDDNKWNSGEGEQWFDWGIDAIPDSLESFQSSEIIIPRLYENEYQIDINNLELIPEPDLVQDTVSLWISEIEQNGDFLTIKIKINTNVELKGLQFQLQHLPFTKIDSIEKKYQESIIKNENQILFEDITIDSFNQLSDNELNDLLMINYTDDLITKLDFDGLEELLDKKELHISHEFSNLVFYLDDTSQIHLNGMYLYIGYFNQLNDYITLNTAQVFPTTDSLVFSMGSILRGFQNGDYGDYSGLIIKTDGNSYNYSQLIIKNDYEGEDLEKNPHLNLMYWE